MSTATAVLPSGPLRLASSSKPTNTFSLRYPASHPPDLSTAGASLSSTASGDVSLRMAPGAQPSETRGRRWAGRQTRPTGDVECAIVWDNSQNSWILHRVDNLVQLASDDPEPFPRKPTPSIQPTPKPASLALPKPARPPPRPTPTISHSQPSTVDPQSTAPFGLVSHATRQPKAPPAPDLSIRASAATDTGSLQHSNSSSSSTPPAEPNQTRINFPAPSETRPGLALPSKKTAGAPSAHQTAAQRFHQRSNTSSTISSPGELGLIPVVQAEEIEEFDFVDSPPDPVPHQLIIAPSPLTLPSPAPPVGHPRQPRAGISNGLNFSPAQRPVLSRSPSLAETHAAGPAGSPPSRSNGLTLPTRSSAPRPSAASPACHSRGVRSSAQLTAPSPLQSVAYSSSNSSPKELGLTAPTPLIITPASASARPALEASRSPAPVWHTHHLQQTSHPNSPYTVPPSSSATVPTRTYQRSDSGSSVRESDTDSEESSSSGEEEVPAGLAVGVATAGAVTNSEEDAEADSDSDGEEDLATFASELEAQMQMGQEEQPGFMEPDKPLATVVVGAKSKTKKKSSVSAATGTGRRASTTGKGKSTKNAAKV